MLLAFLPSRVSHKHTHTQLHTHKHIAMHTHTHTWKPENQSRNFQCIDHKVEATKRKIDSTVQGQTAHRLRPGLHRQLLKHRKKHIIIWVMLKILHHSSNAQNLSHCLWHHVSSVPWPIGLPWEHEGQFPIAQVQLQNNNKKDNTPTHTKHTKKNWNKERSALSVLVHRSYPWNGNN